jgi:sugar O-acyltransferase (sialic acid O-acetyltransferase NeuD family)
MSDREVYAIYGASGQGRETLPLARAMLEQRRRDDRSWAGYELVFVDDAPPSAIVNGYRCLRYEEYRDLEAPTKYFNVAIAAHGVRRAVVERCERDGMRLFSVTAGNVVMLDEAQIDAGCILMPFVTLTSNIRVGRCFHANSYSYVAHDCVVGDYVTFAPAAKCNGNVVVEDEAYIGSGAVLRQGKPGTPLVIGRGAVVGMGAVVTKSVPPGVTVVGNPARPLRKD